MDITATVVFSFNTLGLESNPIPFSSDTISVTDTNCRLLLQMTLMALMRVQQLKVTV